MTLHLRRFIAKSRVLSKSLYRFGTVAVLVLLITSGCALPFLAELDGNESSAGSEASESSDGDSRSSDGDTQLQPQMITVRSESFTIAWDAGDPPVESYNIYYRRHNGEGEWSTLTAVSADTRELEITSDLLADGPGHYDFAVTSVYNGDESEFHTSLSEDAEPERGWYVNWEYL